MNELGTWILRLTFLVNLAAVLLIALRKRADNLKHSGIIAGVVSSIGVLLSTFMLLVSLVCGIFSVEYVFHNTDKALPFIYKVSALWSGSAGSMLFWTSIFAVLLITIYLKNKKDSATKTVFGVILVIMTGFIFLVGFINNPFKHVTGQSDGFGLNPALQSIGMVFHPPIVIIGFCFFFIAFAYMLHDLKEKSSAHRLHVWKWAVWGWILLTAGIITGGLWAYTELGWGGYWAWDPVENMSLVNWFIATAFLHSFRRKENRSSTHFILIALTVFSILIGTFITRSGILKSVHSYSSQAVTVVLGGFILVMAAAVVIMKGKIKRSSPRSQAENSKSSSFLSKLFKPINLTTTLLMLMATLVFGGTIFPLIGSVFTGEHVSTPIAFYDYSLGVLGLVILLLLGICPGLIYRKRIELIPGAVIGGVVFAIVMVNYNFGILTKLCLGICVAIVINTVITILQNFGRLFSNRTYLSSLIIHLSIVMLAFGFAGSKGMMLETEKMLSINDTAYIQDYSVKYQGLKWREEQGKTVAIAEVVINRNEEKEIFKPELAYYHKRKIIHSRAVIKNRLNEDLYIIFEGLDENNRILLKIMVLKWMSMVWAGGILMIIGVLLRTGLKSTSSSKILQKAELR